MIWPKTSMIWFDHDLIWQIFWSLDLIWDLIWFLKSRFEHPSEAANLGSGHRGYEGQAQVGQRLPGHLLISIGRFFKKINIFQTNPDLFLSVWGAGLLGSSFLLFPSSLNGFLIGSVEQLDLFRYRSFDLFESKSLDLFKSWNRPLQQGTSIWSWATLYNWFSAEIGRK